MSLAEQIELACLLEATAPKLGNVHPWAAFEDVSYQDFVTAAKVVAEPLSQASTLGVGKAIYEAIKVTRYLTGTNVNLGIVLLIAPLAAVPKGISIRDGIQAVLAATTVADAEQVYAAIRLAKPGGLGDAASQDVSDKPTVTLTEAMTLAADWDLIAEQYATGFRCVLEDCLVPLVNFYKAIRGAGPQSEVDVEHNYFRTMVLMPPILQAQMILLVSRVDTLISRKCGGKLAEEVRQRAAQLFGWVTGDPTKYGQVKPSQIKAFDDWLREDGHRRNPGAIADLIAATLFIAIRDGMIDPPSREDLLRFAANSDNRPHYE